MELLAGDSEQRRSLAELGERLGAEPMDLDAAVTALVTAGVLVRDDGAVSASAAARRLDELELIAI